MIKLSVLKRRSFNLPKRTQCAGRLMTMDGIGPLVAVTFRAAADDPHRFASSRDAAAYFGLTPRRIQSGRSDFQGSIADRGCVLGDVQSSNQRRHLVLARRADRAAIAE